jgi:ABC-2 type transport system permease protein
MEMQIKDTFSGTHYTSGSASFFSMVRGELMKITWLRSTWIMLAVLISGTAAIYLLNISNSNAHHLLLTNPVQYISAYELSQNLLIFRALSGFMVLFVTAFTFGLEYQQGTIRVILGRGVERSKFMFSKLVALFLMAIVIALGGILLNGVLLVLTVQASTGSLTEFGVILSHSVGVFALTFLYLIFNMWISILLAAAATILGRSLTFGLSVTLLWFPVDNFSPAILVPLFPKNVAPTIIQSLLGQDLNGLQQNLALNISTPGVSTTEWQMIGIALVYAVVFLSISIMLIRQRDVQ